MNDMDWPKPRNRPRRGSAAKGVSVTPAKADGQFERRLLSRFTSPGEIRAAALLIGSAIIGLAAFLTVDRMNGPGQATVTRALPQPTPAGALAPNLPPPNLLKPLSPEEAAAENAQRPFVNRPDTAASRFVLRTDAETKDRALTCLTQAIYYEAASEGVDGGRAVAQVVLNRMRHPGYPASVCGVVYQGADRPTGCQFTFTCDGSLLRAPVQSLWTRSRKIAADALAGKVFAPVGHATHYHADYVIPYWADSLDKTVQIGRHIFYRLRSSLGDSRSFFQRYSGAEPSLPIPDTKVVIAPEAVTPELANALLSDRTAGSLKEVEKAGAQAVTALLVDASHGALIADGGKTPAVAAKKSKTSTECAAGPDRGRLVPLGANDMRSESASTGC